jgi:hypothetical protein
VDTRYCDGCDRPGLVVKLRDPRSQVPHNRLGLVLSFDHSRRLFTLHHRLEAVHDDEGRRCHRHAGLGTEGLGVHTNADKEFSYSGESQPKEPS